MIEDGRHAVPDALENGRVRGSPCPVQGKLPVDRPPLTVEDLVEVCGIEAFDGKSSRQPGIYMRVSVDESRHDQAAVGIDLFGSGILLLQGLSVADIQDLFAVYDNGAVFKERILRVPCDHPSVPDYKHNPASLYDNFTVSLFHSFSLKNELVCHKISEEEKISEN